MNEKLKNILKDYKDEMTEKLQEFIRIKSVTEENPEDCSEAVSYTHLDVYKRQVIILKGKRIRYLSEI